MDKSSERHYVLVHGACHGAWCWYKVATLLRSAGHRITALDMAASGIHPKRVDEVHSMSEYVAPLTEFMESLPAEDRVVLVGHSAGGISISIAMERFPQKISLAVFVTALMPGPGFNMNTVNQEFHINRRIGSWKLSFDKGPDQPPTAFLIGPKILASMLYNLSPPEELTLATMLVRPHPMHFDEELVLKETELTKENYGSVHRAYVVIEGDKIVEDTFQRWLIENNPTHEVKVISGSDHMVMLSNPQELTSCLLGLIS